MNKDPLAALNASVAHVFNSPPAEEDKAQSTETEVVPQLVDEGESAEKAEAPKKESRLDKRLKKLLSENAQLKEELGKVQTTVGSRFQELESEHRRLAAEAKVNQSLLSNQQKTAQELAEQRKLAAMTPLQRWEYEQEKYRKQLENLAQTTAEQKIQEMLAKQEEARRAEQQKIERQNFERKLMEDSEKVVMNIIKDFPEAEAKELRTSMTPWVTVAAAAFNLMPEAASKEFEKTLDKYFKARVKTLQNKSKAQVESATKAPAPLKSVPKGGNEDPRDELTKQFSFKQIQSAVGPGQALAAMTNPDKARKVLDTLLKRGK